MNVRQAKEIRIDSFLGLLGYSPDHTNNHGIWFKSPLRVENTASLVVSKDGKAWLDYGTGENGMIIELVQQFYGITNDVSAALKEIESVVGMTPGRSTHRPIIPQPLFEVERPEQKAETIEIKNVRELKNFALLEYLKSRKIDLEIGQKFCVDVYASLRKTAFYSIGFKNRSGGYALRNKLFKQAVNPSDISIMELLRKGQIANKKEKVPCVLFEGFFDFLSYVQFRKDGVIKKTPVIAVVLNSLSHYEKGVEYMKDQNFCEILSYLDNNTAGREAQNTLENAFKGSSVKVFDEMAPYPHEDLNDALRALK